MENVPFIRSESSVTRITRSVTHPSEIVISLVDKIH